MSIASLALSDNLQRKIYVWLVGWLVDLVELFSWLVGWLVKLACWFTEVADTCIAYKG